MSVVVAGSSGLIGTALVAALRRDGEQVIRLVRRPAAAPDERRWDPAQGKLDPGILDGVDAVVNLCGAGIGDKRWTGAYKQLLRDSRITPTDVLATAAARAGVPTLVNASGVHYYGDTGVRAVDESGPPGTGFLPTLCHDWEAATHAATEAGTRTVLLRSGVVLTGAGGMLPQLRTLFLLGLGGRLGSGRQYQPWISLDDEIGAIRHALTNESVRGPLNVVGPAPVTNAAFTRALGKALNRPTPLFVPGIALRLVIGEFAEEAILHSPRALPRVLEETGYEFRHATVGAALAAAVGR
ncbi:TIGR01777 family oxidoreductase [Nocardia zapadnayensis]|uniref:TIGR01777 family oxidoreductase n=1 Tax=Nocardia rhamnosiphila TaxID=426716 RepID=UPI002245E2A2|nr:TIGR01777 family oxidoreductase [Nocardia zapadnayensis]MCX0274273.1 TIGR01777 family oxidoreductase [Nocardia zapadnayensis]